jgi:hypothetical protein
LPVLRPSRAEPAAVADFLDVFETECRIFRLKLSSKFVLNAISGARAVSILFAGSWLALKSHSDVGTVMASPTGLARIDSTWRELVGFLRKAGTVRVEYAMLVRAITHGESMDRGVASHDGRADTRPCLTRLHDTTETLLTRKPETRLELGVPSDSWSTGTALGGTGETRDTAEKGPYVDPRESLSMGQATGRRE